MYVEISGTLELELENENGEMLSPAKEKEIEEKLRSGEYILALSSGKILSLPSLETVAHVTFDVMSGTDYNYLNEEDL